MVNYVQRARDVRHVLQVEGMEKGTRIILERLCEDNEMMRQEMQAMTKTINKMADIVANIATVGAKLREEWGKLQHDFNRDDVQDRRDN